MMDTNVDVDAYVSLDRALNVVHFSREAERLFGVSAATSARVSFFDLVPSARTGEMESALEQALEGGEPTTVEGLGVGEITVVVRINPFPDGLSLYFRTCPGEGRAFEEVRRNEERLAVATQSGSIGIWDWDVVEGKIYWDVSMYRIYGVDHRETPDPYDVWIRCVHQEERTFLDGEIQAALRGERDFCAEFRITRPDGEVRFLRTSSRTFRASDGTPLRMVGTSLDVTERTRIEMALRESEARFLDAFEYAAIGMALVSTDGHWLKVNKALCDSLGYTETDLLSQSFQDITHPADLDIDMNHVRRMLSGDLQTYSLEKRYFHKRGNVIWALLSVSLVRDFNGAPRYFVSQVLNITERKQAELALRLSEARLSNALKMSRSGDWEFDVDAKAFVFNDNFYRIFGYAADEVGGYRLDIATYAARFCHPDDAVVVAREIQAALDTHDPEYTRQIEHRIVYRDGEPGYISVRIFIHKDESGRTVRIFGVNQDVTERRRVEATLRASDERYRSLFDQATEGILIVDAEGRIVEANPAFAAMHGLTVREVCAKTLFDISKPDPETQMAGRLARVFSEAEGIAWEIEQYHKNGDMLPFSVSASAIHAADRIYALFFYRDLSNQRILERQLREAHKLEVVGQLAGGIAHDFNNLIQVILGHADLLGENNGTNEATAQVIGEITRAGERAAELVAQMLAFSRRQLIQPVNVNLNAVVERTTRMLGRVLGEHIELRFDPAPNLETVYVDEGQIEQALMNLSPPKASARERDWDCPWYTGSSDATTATSMRGARPAKEPFSPCACRFRVPRLAKKHRSCPRHVAGARRWCWRRKTNPRCCNSSRPRCVWPAIPFWKQATGEKRCASGDGTGTASIW